MTYDVLEKVSKKDLIQWMRKNIFLPNISNEKFLRDVKVARLFALEKELLEKEQTLNKQLEANTENTVAFMAILIECQKNDEQLNRVNAELNKLLGWGSKKKGGEG
jgi:hypothetical protein